MRPDAGYSGLLVPICAVRNVHHETPVWPRNRPFARRPRRPR